LTMALRKFIDGEVFYSEDLDSLIAGSNMRFANAAERDATLIGTLGPVAGTVVSLADDSRTYRRSGTQWLPQPGTMCFSYAATNAKSIAASTLTTIDQWNSNLIGRNWANWFNTSTGYFKPDVSGYYEMCAGVCFSQPAANTGARHLCLMNHYTSGYNMTPGQSMATSPSWGLPAGSPIYLHMTPTVISWNGASLGSGIALQVWHGHTSAINVGTDGPSYFSAKYLGP
jgi:hypothetical protein